MSKIIGGTFEDLNEIVAKPIKNEASQIFEQGKQSVSAPKITPQQSFGSAQDKQQKDLEHQQAITDARRKIYYWQDLEAKLRAVREQKKQQEMQRIQQQEQEEKEKKKIKQFQVTKKQEVLNPNQYKGKVEFKRGVGG